MAGKNDNYDTPWKEIIEHFFPQFMEFFVPRSVNDIDWDQEIRFLDTEFQKISKDSGTGQRHTDKLVEVTLGNAQKKWILIHVEVQAQQESNFSERMFVYNYKIYDRFQRPVTSIAILADEQSNWHPRSFGYGMWGCRMELDFIKAKLLDYQDRSKTLLIVFRKSFEWAYFQMVKRAFTV